MIAFLSTVRQRGLPSPPLLIIVAFFPIMRVKPGTSLPQLVA
jgi:hypothetical protein